MGSSTGGANKLQENYPWDSQMMWNHYLVVDFYECIKRNKWVMPVIHGHIESRHYIDGGNRFTFNLIARRSRHHAGTRYLRRGINMHGYVGNWVEIEQIIERHQNGREGMLPMLSSFVQVRGSIPFFWSQIPNPITFKPDIILERHVDLNAVSTRKHFARIFQKYSFPIQILNLTKANNEREETVAAEYRNFIRQTLNKELPESVQVRMLHYDVKAKKKKVKHFPNDLFA